MFPRHLRLQVTDGVVEAREKTGALFGFERTQAISTESAQIIAQAAELFGQNDDITVLTLTRRGVGETSPTQNAVPADRLRVAAPL
jgi:hypothetical protein